MKEYTDEMTRLEKGGVKHIMMGFPGQGETMETLNKLGFAKRQTHGLMNCESTIIESLKSTGELVF